VTGGEQGVMKSLKRKVMKKDNAVRVQPTRVVAGFLPKGLDKAVGRQTQSTRRAKPDPRGKQYDWTVRGGDARNKADRDKPGKR